MSTADFNGKTVVFTGTLAMTRTEARSKALAAGAKVTGGVSENTDFLVCGADPGTKKTQAEACSNCVILTETEFVTAIEGTA